MIKPSFRFLIIPLGAVCTLASLSVQGGVPHMPRDNAAASVRERVADCTGHSPADVCVIASYSGVSAR